MGFYKKVSENSYFAQQSNKKSIFELHFQKTSSSLNLIYLQNQVFARRSRPQALPIIFLADPRQQHINLLLLLSKKRLYLLD